MSSEYVRHPYVNRWNLIDYPFAFIQQLTMCETINCNFARVAIRHFSNKYLPSSCHFPKGSIPKIQKENFYASLVRREHHWYSWTKKTFHPQGSSVERHCESWIHLTEKSFGKKVLSVTLRSQISKKKLQEMNGRGKDEKLNMKFEMKYRKMWMSMGINSSSLKQSTALLHQTGVKVKKDLLQEHNIQAASVSQRATSTLRRTKKFNCPLASHLQQPIAF